MDSWMDKQWANKSLHIWKWMDQWMEGWWMNGVINEWIPCFEQDDRENLEIRIFTKLRFSLHKLLCQNPFVYPFHLWDTTILSRFGKENRFPCEKTAVNYCLAYDRWINSWEKIRQTSGGQADGIVFPHKKKRAPRSWKYWADRRWAVL